jgi:hypothetical protein
MKPIIPALLLSAVLTGCIQSAPVKLGAVPAPVDPPQSMASDNIVKSCLEYKRFVIKFRDDATGAVEYVTFLCRPIFSSKQPPKPPEIKQKDYKGPNALEI